MNPVNIIGGTVFILVAVIGLVRPQWMVRVQSKRSNVWLDPDLDPIRRIVCSGLMIVGLLIAFKGLTSSSR